jgi:chitosanase
MPTAKPKKPAVRTSAKKTKRSAVITVSNTRKQPFFQRNAMVLVFIVAFALIGGIIALVATNAATGQGAIVSKLMANKCLDNSANRKVNKNKVQLYTCNNSDAQKWTVTNAGTIVNANGYCLDVAGASKVPKTAVQLYICNDTVAQKWAVKSDGSIVNPNSGLCLDDKYAGVDNGNQIWMWPCNNTNAQKWVVPTTPKPTTPVPTPTPTPTPAPGGGANNAVTLFNASKKEMAMQLVSSAENSSLNWKAQYGYIEDIGDGRGYTAGIIGFCSGCGDMQKLVEYYGKLNPNNVLAKYLPALKKIGSFNPTHAGLDPNFTKDWKTAAKDVKFQQAQNDERDRGYFNPAVNQGIADGIHTLGQFIYYDAMVVHGPGNDSMSFGGIRAAAMKQAKTPAQGGNETAYLNAFMNARVKVMKAEAAHEDVTRIENAQRVFLKAGNLNLDAPLKWSVYGDPYTITKNP